MKIPFPTKQNIFRVAGIASSVGSYWGTHGYLLHETQDQLLAVTGAGLLGAMIYFGLDAAFNLKHTGQRIVSGSVGLVLAGLSIFTVYQLIELPKELEAEARQEKAATDAESAQQKAIQAAYNKAAADRAAITAQTKTLKTEMANIKELNDADQISIKDREALIKKGIKPNGNTAAIRQIKKDMAERQKRVTTIQAELNTLTDKFTGIKVDLPAQSNAPATNTKNSVLTGIKYDTLARAALYDSATFLFLLFGSFHRRKDDDNAADLKQVITQAKYWEEKFKQSLNHLENAQLKTLSRGDELQALMNKNSKAVESHQVRLQEVAAKSAELLQHLQQEKAGLTQLLNTSRQHQQRLPEILEVASAETKAMQSAINNATELKPQLQDAITACNKVIAGANSLIAPAIKPAITCNKSSKPKMSTDEALQLLTNQSIDESDKGLLPVDLIQTQTGYGRIKAKNLLELAAENGILGSAPSGNGIVYFYPRKTEEKQVANVVSIGARG